MGVMRKERLSKVLIWGKTTPQLSTKHMETVCTGGCLEDGSPVRLYPIPFRYLGGDRQFKLYQWIEVPIAKSRTDTRPESYRIDSRHIRILGDPISHADGWRKRREIIFRQPGWHFDCLEQLKAAETATKQSLGVVKVGQVDKIQREVRSEEERKEFEDKLRAKKLQTDAFGREAKDLAFISERIHLHWRCATDGTEVNCPGHTASVLDWGLYELGRREGAEAMAARMEEVCDLVRRDLHLFMGNIKRHPGSFSIVGLWFPLKREVVQEDLFIP